MARDKKQREGKRTRTRIVHQFTPEEKDQKIRDLTTAMREVETKQEAIKAAAATAKAEVKALLAKITDLRNQVDDGCEPREVDAVVVFDRKKGNKAFFRFCPGQPGHDEKLKVENMSEADYAEAAEEDQTKMPFEPKALEGGAAAAAEKLVEPPPQVAD